MEPRGWPIGRCLRGAGLGCVWWSWFQTQFLLAVLMWPRMAGMRLDFGLLLEPLCFIKVLEWVSGVGDV